MILVILFYFSFLLWSCFRECSWYHILLNSGYIQLGLGLYSTPEYLLLSEKIRYSFIMTKKSVHNPLLMEDLLLLPSQWASAFPGSHASQCSCTYYPAEVTDTESDLEKWRIQISVWWQRCDYKIPFINVFSSCSTPILCFYLTSHSRLSSFTFNFCNI